MDQQAINNFKEKLDSQHSFPGEYTFKFIVPNDKVNEVRALFGSETAISEKESSKGTYKSITARSTMPSSGAVIEVYIQAKSIEGIISL